MGKKYVYISIMKKKNKDDKDDKDDKHDYETLCKDLNDTNNIKDVYNYEEETKEDSKKNGEEEKNKIKTLKGLEKHMYIKYHLPSNIEELNKLIQLSKFEKKVMWLINENWYSEEDTWIFDKIKGLSENMKELIKFIPHF